MAAREENILNVPISETLEGMHVLCDTGDTGEPYRVAASLFIAEATQAAKDAVSNLDPKDVILKGFTALTAGKPAITANSTLLAAIQSLYAMVGSGKVKIVSDGADQTGMVSWNGTSASGFVINVNEAAIYTRSQWTQSNPDSVTDANWIAAVKTGGTKTPFAAVGTLTLTTFANLTANASVRDMKIGEMLGFYSSNGGSTSGPGASPLFGYIQKTSSSQVNIFAYTIDGKKSWLGYNAGSNVTWTPVGGASGGNVIHGEDITEGLEYLIPENVGDVVAFRSTMDSSQVPAGQEGFGFLAKVNGSESMAMMMQNDPAGGGKMKFFMGRVQNDGTGTDWQELTTGSSGVKKLPGLDVELNESTGVITYTSTELVPLSAGTTLLLCFELADSGARFSPCGNVVVYYDLPPANNLWGTIAGFFDNATSSNGFINARRRGAGIIDFECLSALVDGYPSLQVYLKHILILG